MCRNFQSWVEFCGPGSQMRQELPVMGTVTGHIGLCLTAYCPQDSFRSLESSIVELLRKWWPILDAHSLAEDISILLQYSMQSNLQYPASSFISTGEMYFTGTTRLSDQLCTKERRKEGDALAGVKTLWHYSRSWCLFQDKSCLERCVGQWPATAQLSLKHGLAHLDPVG